MKAKKLISAFLILMVITATVFVPSTAYGAEGGGEYKTVKNVPSDSSAEFVTYDTAKFSNDYIKTPNTDIEFFVNATTWEAYRVPSAHGNASDLTADMLKDVFGITTAYADGYNYTYAAGKLSIYKDCGLAAAENQDVTAQIINSDFKYMVDSHGNNLAELLNSKDSNNNNIYDLSKIKYTYTSDGVLTLTQEMTVADTKYTDVNIGNSLSTYSTAIGTLFSKLRAEYDTPTASLVDYDTIVAVTNDTNFTTYTDTEVAAAAVIKSILDNAQLTGKADTGSMSDVKFSLVSLTGTGVIHITYTGTKQEAKPFPSTSAEYKSVAVEEKNVSGGFMAGIVPKYVYNSLDTYGLSYYLPSYSLEWAVTKNSISADFLRTVFPAADEDITKLLAEMDLNLNRAYKITINSSGYLQITHEEPIPEYEIKWVMDNGDLIETTSVKEGLVPTQADPTKTGIAGYTYTFDGWYPEVKAATEDAVYVATFKETTDTGEGYKTVKNLPADSTTDSVTFDTAKFSNANIKAPNADIKYFANAATWKAYRIPSAHGNAGNLNADMLKDVFGITTSYPNEYNYTYAAGKLSVYRNCELTAAKDQAVTAQIVDGEFKYMADSQGNNLKDDVDAYVSGGGSFDKLKYTYTSDGVLTLTQEMTVADTKYTDVNIGNSLSTYSTAIGTLFSKLGAEYGTPTASLVDYDTIVAVANDTDFTTYTDTEVAAAAAIKSILTNAQLTGKADTGSMSDVKFSLVSLTGDNGIKISYTGTTQATKPFPDATASTSAKYKYTAVAEEKNVSGGFMAGIVPKYVYNSLDTYGLSYYLPSYSLEWAVTKNSISADFLRTVFPAADEDITKLLAEMDLNLNRAYKITITSSGYLQITHEEPLPSYEIKWVMDNGDPIATTSVKEGSLPKYTGATPVKEADSQYTYTFDGWTPEITAATGDTEYKAVFTAKENTYSIVSQGTTSQSLTWKKGSGLELTITAKQDGDIDRSFEDFTGVKMNGSLLERDKDYKASKGSTIITVSPDALEQLPVGENTLTVKFAFGEASVVINVLEADKLDSPPTGDPVSPFALMSMIAISAAAIAILIVMKRRKKAQ